MSSKSGKTAKPAQPAVEFSEEQMQLAAMTESAAANEAMMTHLNQRVIGLRANLDRALAENADLRGELAKVKRPADRKPKSKSTSKSKSPTK